MRNFIISVMLAVFAFSCGDSVATKSKPKNDDDSSVSENDSDQTASDDENVNDDNQTTKDDEVVKDDISVPDEDSVISDTCGNTSIEWPEVCDGGTMDCVDIDDTKYSSGKAKCKDNCSGWDTATCVEIEPENCMNGDRRCYGAYQYQICAGGVWGEAETCSKSGTCYGEGLCSNDCYPHGSYSCYNGHVYWYDTCGEIEEIKENCGTSGYTGSKYCVDDEIYQDYKTVGCDYQSCDSDTESTYIEYCENGCASGVCNGAGEEESWYDSTSELTWQNSKFSAALSLSSASSYCSSLTFDGYSDWRLPTISELRSLIRGCSNAETEGSCKVTDYCSSWETCTASCFSCTSGNGPSGDNNYWDSNLDGGETSLLSATPVPGYSGYNWYIDFTTAEISYSFDTAATNFRCVRGTMPGDTLTAPTNVTASDGDFDNYIIISWDKVPGATNYNIYRSTSPLSGYSHLQNLGVTDYSIDYPPHASITYYYKISAYNSTYGESELSSYNSGYSY